MLAVRDTATDSSFLITVEQCPACDSEFDVSGQLPLAKVSCPSCGSQVSVLQQFGNLTIRERLGQGGMGAVYRAFEPLLERELALKLLRPEFLKEESRLAQLESEALVMASLNHPNVVRIFSVGCERGLRYISMEVVENGSLESLMAQQGHLQENQLLRIALDAANGLAAVYALGLIHRDVKPGNILFDASGCAKIVDFGLATPSVDQEGNGEVFGSPFYLSPERITGEGEDLRSDIYSLGATLFHAAAGRPPFDAPTAMEVAMKHAHSRAPKLRVYAPQISGRFASIIDRMLQRNRESRYESYEELIADLTYVQNQSQQGAMATPVAESWREISHEADKQQALWSWVAMGMLVLAMAGLGAFFLWPGKNADVPPDALADVKNDLLVEPQPSPAATLVPSTVARLIHEFDFEGVSELARDEKGGVTLDLLNGARLVPGGVSGDKCLEVKSALGAKAAVFLPQNGLRTTSGVPGITLSAWIKPTSYPKERAAVVSILAGGDPSSANSHNAKFMARSNFVISGKGEVFATIRKNDKDQSATTSSDPGTIALGQWAHVVLSVDYTATNRDNGSVEIFINGKPVNKLPLSRPLSAGSASSKTPSFGLVIGSNRAEATPSEQFDGLIDKVQVYSKSLTQDEASALYDGQRP